MTNYITKHLKELFHIPNLAYGSPVYSTGDELRRYSKKSPNLLKRIWNELKKHKIGYTITGVAEGVWLKYLFDLRRVATNFLVEAGLKKGLWQVIKYPIRPEIFWPRIVDVTGQIPPMEPVYETDVIKYTFLSLARNPISYGVLATIPIIAYGVYRLWKYKKRR